MKARLALPGPLVRAVLLEPQAVPPGPRVLPELRAPPGPLALPEPLVLPGPLRQGLLLRALLPPEPLLLAPRAR